MSEKPVGYKNPPTHSQYKKGSTGNPGGRKKGSKNFKTLLQEVMESEIEMLESGKKRSVPLSKALVLKQAECGLKGDWKAIESLLDRLERHFPDQSEPERELPDEDEEMLDRFLDQNSNRPSSAEGPQNDG